MAMSVSNCLWQSKPLTRGTCAQILDQYDFGRMKLLDVAVTPDSSRLIGVGPLLESPTGLQPSKSRAEKRLVGEFVAISNLSRR
jgi:hypothetical protein